MLVNNGINPTALTNNEKKIKNCLDGVFNYQSLPISMLQAHKELSEKVLEDAEKFKYPLLLLYGSKDNVQPISDVKAFYRMVGSKEKTSYVFKTGYHHLHDDEKAEKEVFPKIVDWIFDMNSNKNQVKWSATTPFNLNLIKRIPSKVKYTILVLIPLVIGFLIKLIIFLRARLKKKKMNIN